MASFINVAVNVGLLVVLALPGYILRRVKLFTDTSVKALVLVLIFAAQPFTAGKSFLTLKYSKELGIGIATSVGLFVLTMMLVLVFSMPVFRRKDEEGRLLESERIFRFSAMFGNTGYLGIPLISALFPGEQRMLLYTSICIVVFNIMTWTVGVWVLTGDKKYMSAKKAFINPVLIAALLTMPFFFIPSVTVPTPIVRTVELLGGMTAPLSMMILGARLAEMRFKEIFSDVHIHIVSALRLIGAPVIAFLLLKLCKITDPLTFNTVMVICSMPSAASTIVFAERFMSSSYSAIKTVLCTSVLCIATIPLILMLTLI